MLGFTCLSWSDAPSPHALTPLIHMNKSSFTTSSRLGRFIGSSSISLSTRLYTSETAETPTRMGSGRIINPLITRFRPSPLT